MSHDVVISVVTLLLVLRVFGPDVRTLIRWTLGTGVRVGVAALAEQHRRAGVPQAPVPPHEQEVGRS